MMKNYKSKINAAFLLFCFFTGLTSLSAQVSSYSFAQSNGAYAEITGGTVINSTSAASVDDNVYTAIPIGFSFVYNGTTYTDFGFNANGWLSMGTTAPVSSTTAISTGTTNNVIAAFNNDLIGRQHCVINRTLGNPTLTVTNGNTANLTIGASVTGTGIPAGATIVSVTATTITISANATSTGTGSHLRIWDASLRYETVGVAPNRKLVLQWKNFARYSTTSGGGDQFNFQIVLNETSNQIDVIYGNVGVGTMATGNTMQVGLRGASNADYNNRSTTTNWAATVAGGTNAATSTITNTVFPASGLTFSWIPPVPCAGTPNAGTTAGPVGACPSVNFGLSLTGATTGVTGLTYQWQSSADGVTYSNIASATASTATVNQAAATYYQCIVTCSNGGAADTSAALLVPMNSFLNCYCSSGLTTTGGAGDIITNVVLTNSVPASLTQASGGAAPWFTSYNNTPLDLMRGTTNNTVAITMGTDGTQYSAVWVDWNQNGTFDAAENVALAATAGGASSTVTYTFSVPVNALLGNTRIRIRGGSDGAYTAAGACAGTAYGETEDYIVNIICPTFVAPSVTGASICSGNTATLSATASSGTSTLTWFDAASAGANLGTGTSYTTPVLTSTTSYWVEESIIGCAASPRAQVTATVIPVNAALTPVNVTCNGGSDGSFTLGAITCGTTPFDYSVNGGAFGAIPTNLAAGTYSVVIRDAGLQQSSPISVVIGQPAWTINNPVGSNIVVCQNSSSAILNASATLNPVTTGTQVVTFGLAAQPTEVSATNATPTVAGFPNIISSATIAALPAGAVVTSVTFSFPNITPTGGSWASDVMFGFTGSVNSNYAVGTGAPGTTTNFNYNYTLTAGAVNVSGGVVNLHYYDYYSDNAGSESTFPIGATVATMTINYTYPPAANITWWDASTGGTQLGAGNSLETVGTSVLANTTTPGTYNFYAQGNNLGCTSPARTLVTVTVKPTATGSQTLTVCAGGSVTVGTTTHNTTGVFTDVLTAANGCDSTVTTNLTVSPAITGSQTLTVCAGGSVTVGTTTHNTTGVFTDVLAAANGCDSTVTTNLTVSPAITGSQTLTVCAGGSVTVGTTTHNTTGVFTDVLTAANGCDSTVTTNLTVSPAITGSQTLTVCAGGSVTVGTSTHNTTGVFTDVLTAANGCDSTVTTNLTVSPAITGSQTLTVCAGGSVTVGLNTYNATGIYTDVFTAANGCDSTYTTDLTVSPAITGSQTLTVCAGGSVTVGSSTYNATGIYTDVFTAANGCDSTYTTDLTVLNALDLSTSVVGNVITATSSTATYQWIDCDNGNAIITGETNQSYTASASGNYAVIITEGGLCSDTSACVNVIATGIVSNNSQVINIYPNPSSGQFTLSINNALSNQVVISILDLQGKVVYSESDKNVSAQYNKQIDLTDLAKGIYYVKLSIGAEVQIQKLIVQ